MSLVYGQKLNRENWTPLTIPQDVIKCVHSLARRNPNGLTICDRECNILPEDHTDDDSDDDS